MTNPTPELDAILRRLDKVERENRIMKRAGSLALLVAGAVLVMAQGRPNRRVEAEEFVLQDAAGNARAALAVRGEEARLVVFDNNGKTETPLAEEQHALSELRSLAADATKAKLAPSPAHRSHSSHARAQSSPSVASVQLPNEGSITAPATLSQSQASASEARSIAQPDRSSFELAPPLVSAVPPQTLTASAVQPQTAGAPAFVSPPATLKILGYADAPGVGRSLFISDDSQIFVVREGQEFADRFKVLKITPTEVDVDDESRHEIITLSFNP